jgi:hypothetical protein
MSSKLRLHIPAKRGAQRPFSRFWAAKTWLDMPFSYLSDSFRWVLLGNLQRIAVRLNHYALLHVSAGAGDLVGKGHASTVQAGQKQCKPL